MKKFYICILAFFLSFGIAYASLDGQSYELNLDETIYTVTFVKGPFSGGEGGNVNVLTSDGTEFTLHYTLETDITGNIDGMKFILSGDKLFLFTTDPLTFTKVPDIE